MSIVIEKRPVPDKKYIHPFVPNKANWSEIKLSDESWKSKNGVNPNAIYVDVDNNASVAELGDLVIMIRKIVRFYGSVLKSLSDGVSFESEKDGVYWVTTSNEIDVKSIIIRHSYKGVVGDAYTHFSDFKSAHILANTIKFAFGYYGINAEIIDKTQ